MVFCFSCRSYRQSNSLLSDREFKYYCMEALEFLNALLWRFGALKTFVTYPLITFLSFSYKSQLRFLRPHSFQEIFSNGRFEQWRRSPTMLFQHFKYLLIINLFMSYTFQSIKRQQLGIRVYTVNACCIYTVKISHVQFNARNAASHEVNTCFPSSQSADEQEAQTSSITTDPYWLNTPRLFAGCNSDHPCRGSIFSKINLMPADSIKFENCKL